MEEVNQQRVTDELPTLKERHGCVTAWLVFMIITNAGLAVYYFFFTDMVLDGLSYMDIYPPKSTILLLGGMTIINVILALMLLSWKKWAFWSFGVMSIIAFVVNLSIGLPIAQSIMGLFSILILFAILQIKENGVSAWDNME